jgi:hypothetical protein
LEVDALFSNCLQSVEKYTLPVILSRLRFDNQIESFCGTFIVLNRDGWVLTAAHLIKELKNIENDAQQIQAYNVAKQAIENDTQLAPKKKRAKIGALGANPGWVVQQATLWIGPSRITNVRMDEPADLAIGRLEPFDSTVIASYPVFKNPAEPMYAGTSLCRLGYPFHEIKATYDHATNQFDLAPGVLPVPRFPNDGIHTRLILIPFGTRTVKFIETSSPGLKGQSGGPIFDAKGHVWAMQAQTNSLQLGFSPTVKVNGREIVEHQFMHVGWGSHVEEIINFLRTEGVAFSLSS